MCLQVNGQHIEHLFIYLYLILQLLPHLKISSAFVKINIPSPDNKLIMCEIIYWVI